MSKDGIVKALDQICRTVAKERKQGMEYLGTMDAKKAMVVTRHGMWTTVMTVLRDCIKRELNSNKKRHEDYVAVMLTLVRRAPTQEAGWPLAAAMDVIVTKDLLSWMEHPTVAQSATNILDWVLKEPKYCEGISRDMAREIMTRLMARLDDDDRRGAELTHLSITRARMLAHLLANYRRDMRVWSKEHGDDTHNFVRKATRFAATWMARHGVDEQHNMKLFPDTAEEVLGGLNAIMFKYGVDCTPQLEFGPQDGDSSFGEIALSFVLQNFRQYRHASKAVTYLEHMRLQLHLARSQGCQSIPWAIDARSPVAQNLDKMLTLAMEACVSNAGQLARSITSASAKNREAWPPLEYRDRLSLLLAAEVIFAVAASIHAESTSTSEPSYADTICTSAYGVKGSGGGGGAGGGVGGGGGRQAQPRKSRRIVQEDSEGEEDDEGSDAMDQDDVSRVEGDADDDDDMYDDDEADDDHDDIREDRRTRRSTSPASRTRGRQASTTGGKRKLPGATSAKAPADSPPQSPYMRDRLLAVRECLSGVRPSTMPIVTAASTQASTLTQQGASQVMFKTGATQMLSQASTAYVERVASSSAGSGASSAATASMHTILAHLQVVTAVAEHMPAGGEGWVLTAAASEDMSGGKRDPMVAAAELVALVEGVLVTRTETIIMMWCIAALYALGGLELGSKHRDTRIHTHTHTSHTGHDPGPLRAAWRSVMLSLLRPDLRYWSATGKPKLHTLGEGVLRLLVRLVSGPLLLAADIANLQEKLWALPAFHNPASYDSPWPLNLARALLHRSELLEGPDTIGKLWNPFIASAGVTSGMHGTDAVEEDDDDDDVSGEGGSPEAQQEEVPRATTRAERLADVMIGWLHRQVFLRRSSPSSRSSAITTGIRALLDLVGSTRYRLPPTDSDARPEPASTILGASSSVPSICPYKPFAVGHSWSLLSPWRALTEESANAQTHAYTTHTHACVQRTWVCRVGGTKSWRGVGSVLDDAPTDRDVDMLPHVEGVEVDEDPWVRVGAGLGTGMQRVRGEKGGQQGLMRRVVCYLERWTSTRALTHLNTNTTNNKAGEEEGLARLLLLSQLLGLLCICGVEGGEGARVCAMLERCVSRLQDMEWIENRRSKAPVLASVAANMLSALPLGRLVDAPHLSVFVCEAEGGGMSVRHESLSKEVAELMAVLQSRTEEVMADVIPEPKDGAFADDGDDDQEHDGMSDEDDFDDDKGDGRGTSEEEADALMADIPDDDDDDDEEEEDEEVSSSQRGRKRGKSQSTKSRKKAKGGKHKITENAEAATAQRRTTYLAREVSKSPFSLKELLAWTRLWLVLTPTKHTRPRVFLKAALTLALDEPSVDIPRLLRDCMFLLLPSTDYGRVFADLARWITDGRQVRPEPCMSEEVRYYHVLRTLCLVTSGPKWLSRAREGGDYQFQTIMAMWERESLSWYNRAALMDAWHASFLVTKLAPTAKGDRQLVFRNIIGCAQDGDSKVRISACRVIPSMFHIYTSPSGIWDQMAQRKVLVGPRDVAQASGPKPSTTDRAVSVLLRLSQLMALGVAGCSSDKVTRKALLTICEWWACPDDKQSIRVARALRPMAEAVITFMAKCLGYGSGPEARARLLEAHLDYLLHEWVIELRLDLRCFPRHLLVTSAGIVEASSSADTADDDHDGSTEGMSEGLRAFLISQLPRLVPLGCLSGREEGDVYRFDLLGLLGTAGGYGGRVVDHPGCIGRTQSGVHSQGGVGSSIGRSISGASTQSSVAAPVSRENRVAALLEAHMVEIKAWEMLLTAAKGDDVQYRLADVRSFLERMLLALNAQNMIASVLPRAQDLLVCMLDLLCVDAYGPLAALPTEKSLQVALTAAAKALGRRSIGDLWRLCNPSELLLHLKARLAGATRPSRAMSILHVLRHLIALMGDAALHPAPLGLALHVLLWALEKHPSLRLPALMELEAFLKRALAQRADVLSDGRGNTSAAQHVGPHIGTIVSSMFSVLVGRGGDMIVGGAVHAANGNGSVSGRTPMPQTHSSVATSTSTDPAAALVGGVMVAVGGEQDPKEEQAVKAKAVEVLHLLVDQDLLEKWRMALLDPLPQLAGLPSNGKEGDLLDKVREKLEEDRRKAGARDPLDYVSRMSGKLASSAGQGRAGQMTRLLALKALLAYLDAKPAPLLGPQARRVLVPALLGICREAADAEDVDDATAQVVRLDATRALGTLGVVPPCELVVWEPPQPPTDRSPCQAAMGRVLKMLLAYLTGSDARIVTLAVHTLRAVLLDDGGHGNNTDDPQRMVAKKPPTETSTPAPARLREEVGALLTSKATSSSSSTLSTPGLASYVSSSAGELSPQDRDLLQSFSRSTTRRRGPAGSDAAAAYDARQSPSLSIQPWSEETWDPSARPYAEWITTLATALIAEATAMHDDGAQATTAAAVATATSSRTSRRTSSVEPPALTTVGPGSPEIQAVQQFVRHCAAAASAQPALAEALLPLIILSLVRGHSPDDRASTMPDRMAECLRRCLPKAGPRPLQALVSSLNFLHAQSIHESKALMAHASKFASEREPKRASAKDLPPTPGYEGFGFFMRELSKLDVAKAALRCGALTSAAMYLELYMEDKRQAKLRTKPGVRDVNDSAAVVLGGGPEDEQKALLLGEVNEARLLLLQISSRLSEPDGAAAQGIQAGTNVEGHIQACSARGEGVDWPQALAGHDCLLQLDHWSTGSSTIAPTPTTTSTSANSSLGMAFTSSSSLSLAGAALSLQHLELGHVLSAYLAGVSQQQLIQDPHSLQARTDASHAAALRELEFQSSWRACRWEPIVSGDVGGAAIDTAAGGLLRGPEPFVPRFTAAAAAEEGIRNDLDTTHHDHQMVGPQLALLSSRGGRFHEHMHACLRALAAQDGSTLTMQLRSARTRLLSCLANEVPFEPSRLLGPLLARLQSLREVEEVASMRLSTTTMLPLFVNEDDDEGQQPKGGLRRRGSVKNADAERLLQVWKTRSAEALADDFELAEPILALREVLVRALCPPLKAREALVRHVCDISKAARVAGSLTVAAAAVDRVSETMRRGEGAEPVVSIDKCACKLEHARVLWARGEAELAIRMAAAVGGALQSLSKRNFDGNSRALFSEALQLAGRWMSASGTESTVKIREEFFLPAVERAIARTPQKRAAHLTLASFLSDLYQRRSERLRSEEMVKKLELLNKRKAELQALKRQLEATPTNDPGRRNLVRRVNMMSRELSLDEDEYNAVLKSLEPLLLEALEHFREALVQPEDDLYEDDDGAESGEGGAESSRVSRDLDTVFQVMALWFEPANLSRPQVHKIMALLVKHAPTYKFVSLMYQILSRLGTGPKEFSDALEHLVMRVCKDHPHHTLPQLINLRNGKRVSAALRDTYEQILSLDEKVKAADSILNSLLREGGSLESLVKNTERLVEGYILLACIDKSSLPNTTSAIRYTDLKKEPAALRSFPKILDSGGPCRPAVLSRLPPLDPLCAYDNDMEGGSVVRVAGFESRFTISESGLSKPIIMRCYGSDGKSYKQVVKRDEAGGGLRPDAVMMQVFETVNTLLAHDPQSRRRQLRIRTYRIVPLTPDCGVMEFVDQTRTLGSVLVDQADGRRCNGLHERYNGRLADEWDHKTCRDALKACKDSEERRKAYQKICAHFHPAFRFFFLETYPDPALWYRRRLHYTRTVAINSIVGYILGIGDRHASNILLDTATAGLVHIDFGYTFEQGKVLPQPETVPFRLTRDLVDAMGASGTEGVFRQCCNVSMTVMRQHAASLLTILEVCVHDPLHGWVVSVNPGAGGPGAGEDDDEGSGRRRRRPRLKMGAAGGGGAAAGATTAGGGSVGDAERALLRIKQKLKGYEDPHGDAMSVEGHVKYLINQATNPDNLCRIFQGWSPWL